MRFYPCACLIAMCLMTTTFGFAATMLQTGKELFSTPLGSNGKSCNSCHPEGKGLEHADEYPGEQLREMINFCIRDALKGEMLSLDDPRLVQLEHYILSLKK